MTEPTPFDDDMPSIGEKQDLHSEAVKQKALDKLMMEWYWKINIRTATQEGLDMVSVLRRQYGEENVLVLRAIYDPDSDSVVGKKQGALGVWVRKGVDRHEVN